MSFFGWSSSPKAKEKKRRQSSRLEKKARTAPQTNLKLLWREAAAAKPVTRAEPNLKDPTYEELHRMICFCSKVSKNKTSHNYPLHDIVVINSQNNNKKMRKKNCQHPKQDEDETDVVWEV